MNEIETTTPVAPGIEPKSARRSMMSGLAVAGLGMAAASLLTPSKALAVSPALQYSQIPGTGDVQVLNYALALEDLEADLYAQALMRLTTGGTNALGTKITGLGYKSSELDVAYVTEFGKVEVEHRDFIRGALGLNAIVQLRYDFNMQNLTRQQVSDLVYTAEKTGVGAYLGAIPFLQTKTYLQIAGAIQGTEARHTAVFAEVINLLFNEGLATAPQAKAFGGTNNGIDAPLAPNVVLSAVSGFIVL